MIRVGVLRGGPSEEYGVSLATGEHILSHLCEEPLSNKYEPLDILVDKNGAWHVGGLQTSLEKLHHKVDVIINALHGAYGEDGKVQNELAQWNIPYTGSGAFASARSMHKVLAKEAFRNAGIKTPKHIIMPDWGGSQTSLSRRDYTDAYAREAFNTMAPPWIVKPVSSGSSDRICLAKTLPDLAEILFILSENEGDFMIEEYIDGREVTVGLIEGFRGEKLYKLPIVEIQKVRGGVHGYTDKYESPAKRYTNSFEDKGKKLLMDIAERVHNELDLSHYSSVDIILHPKRGPYVLEANSLPGLTPVSIFPHALQSVGASMSELIDHIIKLAINKK